MARSMEWNFNLKLSLKQHPVSIDLVGVQYGSLKALDLAKFYSGFTGLAVRVIFDGYVLFTLSIVL